MPSTEERVKQLLGQLTEPTTSLESGQNFAYENMRQIYADPNDANKTILRVRVLDENGTITSNADSASPIARDEILMQMHEIALSAKALSGQDQTKQKAIDRLYHEYTQFIETQNLVTRANLFESKEHPANVVFQQQLKQGTKLLAEFMDIAAEITDTDRKALDAQGHLRRSQFRPTMVHEFKTSKTKEDGETQFIIYESAGRLTAHQKHCKALLGEQNVSNNHSTTSHQKSGLTQGNSSFVRMIVGTKHADGSITIANDSFSGPGARMPYEDLKGADEHKRMAVKATTFLNQEEIIQAMAQRVYERHLVGKTDVEIKAYFKEHPLSETYMQVISPSQANYGWLGADKDFNREQFEFVRDAIRAFDGAQNLPLQIDLADGRELTINGTYKGHHGALGVNWFKTTSDNIAAPQNARLMNEMLDETVASLPSTLGMTGGKVAQSFEALQSALLELQASSQIKNQVKPNETTPLLNDLQHLRDQYRDEMVKYNEAYISQSTELAGIYETVQEFETKIAGLELNLDDIVLTRGKALKQACNSDRLVGLLSYLKAALEANLISQDVSSEEKEQQRSVYNRCAYLIEAQHLYTSGAWAQDKHNFELQTLVSSLACELDHANTKGCKSNNDRGQRLTQKIAGNALVTSMSDTGLYDGAYFKEKQVKRKLEDGEQLSNAEQIDMQLPTIQALHHAANTGVSGGKFELRNKQGFADNEMLGKPAKLAKLKGINKVPFYKNKKNWLKAAKYLAVGGVVGVVAFVAISTILPAIAIIGAGIVGGLMAAGGALMEFFHQAKEMKQVKAEIRAKANDVIFNSMDTSLNIHRSTSSMLNGLGGSKAEAKESVVSKTAPTMNTPSDEVELSNKSPKSPSL